MEKMTGWRKVLYVLAVGTVCFFLSEGFFWARWRTDFNFISSVQTWLIYCFITYTTLVIIDQFKVHDFWGVFLAGAIYGWLVEGVVVGTLYEDFPLGISFTGLAWHGLFSVGVGLYALPRLLRRAEPGRIAWISAAAGLVYGGWAIWWWGEDQGNINTPVPWFIYSLGMTLLCVFALWSAGRLSSKQTFSSQRRELTLLLIVWSVFFVFMRIFSYWWGLFVLPLLMLMCFLALRKGKKAALHGQRSVLQAIQGKVPLENLLMLLVMPVSALVLYSLAYGLGLLLPTNILFYTILTPAGFVLLILALVKLFSRKGTIQEDDLSVKTGE
jgi:hypothetical protein